MSDKSPTSRPRKWNPPVLVAAGALTVAVGVSVGIAATSGHKSDAALSGKIAGSTQTPGTLTTSAASLPSSDPSSSSSAAAQLPSSAASASASSRSAGSAPWSSTSCPSQMASWRGTGAGGQLQVVVTNLTIASQAAASMRADPASGTIPAAAVTGLSSATKSLRLSTQAAGKNLIPDCVSSAHQAEVAALTALGHAADGFGTAVNQSASGDYATAQQSSQAAVAALQSGSAEIATAIVDVSRYGTK